MEQRKHNFGARQNCLRRMHIHTHTIEKKKGKKRGEKVGGIIILGRGID